MCVYLYYRCVSSNNTSDNLPGFCRRYYDLEEYLINGSLNIDLRRSLGRINDMFQSESYNLNPCVELMENILCNYYFPLCDQITGEITPVCRSSCALLANNVDCTELMEIVNDELSEVADSPGNCLQTYRDYDNLPAVSDNCVSIEG